MKYYTYLKSFVTVYRLGTLAGAAEVLELSTTAVSKQIDVLEHKFGNRLFIKKDRKLHPTNFGIQLAEIVGPNLNSLEIPFTPQARPQDQIRLSLDREFSHILTSSLFEKYLSAKKAKIVCEDTIAFTGGYKTFDKGIDFAITCYKPRDIAI